MGTDHIKTRKEIQALYDIVAFHLGDGIYEQYEIDRLTLVLEEKAQVVIKSALPLSEIETQFLMELYPPKAMGRDGLTSALDSIFSSPIGDFNFVLKTALKNTKNDYYVKLVEILAKNNKPYRSAEGEDYTNYLLGFKDYGDDLLQQKQVKDDLAKVILMGISFFTEEGEIIPRRYGKLFFLLRKATYFADMDNLELDSYEFTKFYILRKLYMQESGEEKLISRRRKVFDTFPPKGAPGWQANSRISEVSLHDYIIRGGELKNFLETTRVELDNLVVTTVPKTIRNQYSETYKVFPSYSQVILKNSNLRPEEMLVWKNIETDKGYNANDFEISVFVQDVDVPVLIDDAINVLISSEEVRDTRLIKIYEGQFYCMSEELLLCSPLGLKDCDVQKIDVKQFAKQWVTIEVYVDKALDASKIIFRLVPQLATASTPIVAAPPILHAERSLNVE